VVLENFAATLAQALPNCAIETVILTEVGDAMPGLRGYLVNFVVRYVKRLVPRTRIAGAVRYRQAMIDGRRLVYQDPVIEPNDIAFLQYTGGTTGVAKGAMLSHANVVSNVMQLTAWVAPFIDARTDVTITALPLYHIFALTVNLFSFIELGSRNVLITNPRDIPALVRLFRRERFAFFTGVNTLFNALLHADGFDELDLSGLKVALAGGMAVRRDVAQSWQAQTGVAITQGYGLTEASPVVSANRLDLTEFTGSIGLPLPSTDVTILDKAGLPLPPGEIGEIAVKGPQVMVGYWQRPDETAATFSPGGWLMTGDMGRFGSDGQLYIEDRKKDIIIVSGFNVYPSEVEDAVTLHADVLEAAAIGVPSDSSGEAVKLFVVRKNPKLDEATLLAHCKTRLTGYKTPDIIEFVDSLPKSNVGKVLRRELK
jgi:long-chain acyl-CoA synthetase